MQDFSPKSWLPYYCVCINGPCAESQLQKQRADILKLKSLVGHKNIEIQDLKLEAEDVIDITETKIPNFLPPSVKFHEVTQELKKWKKK